MELLSLKEPNFVYLLQRFNCCFNNTPRRDNPQTYLNEILIAVQTDFFFESSHSPEMKTHVCANSVATIIKMKTVIYL